MFSSEPRAERPLLEWVIDGSGLLEDGSECDHESPEQLREEDGVGRLLDQLGDRVGVFVRVDLNKIAAACRKGEQNSD